MEWWVWALLAAAVIVVAVGVLWRRQQHTTPPPTTSRGERDRRRASRVDAGFGDQGPTSGAAASIAARDAVSPRPDGEAAAEQEDDLSDIEGIRPHIHDVLHGEGITTFAKLADQKPERLREILSVAGLTDANPDQWPEQARLAADGRWDDLRKLQDLLKAGDH